MSWGLRKGTNARVSGGCTQKPAASPPSLLKGGHAGGPCEQEYGQAKIGETIA